MPVPEDLFYEKDKLRGLVPTSDNGRADVAYAAWFEGVDAENDPEFHIALAQSTDPRFKRFLEMIGKPNRQGLKIQTMAKQCGIDLGEFQQWYGRACVQMAIGVAQKNARFVVADMAGDARSRSEFCERCDGLGWVGATEGLPIDTPGYRIMGMRTVPDGEGTKEEPVWVRTCPKCEGKMRNTEPGDEHSRDRILELAGLSNKGKAAVQITQNFGGASHTSAVSGALSNLTIDVDVTEEGSDGV